MHKENSFVRIKEVSKWYAHKKSISIFRSNKKWIKAIDKISIKIDRGQVLGVIGESGCGKSTLGKVLARLEEPTSGDIYIDGVSTEKLITEDAKKFRRLVQIIFQNPFDTFTPRSTIEDIMMRPLKLHNIEDEAGARKDIIIKSLLSGGLYPAEEILKRYPHELSGGQLQRISILRAMLLNPKFVIADEPVSMLDVSVRAEIINMLKRLSKEKNAAVVFISHDIALTRYISHKVAVMYLGKIVEYGDCDEIISNPKHPYTKVLISNCPSIDPAEEMMKIEIKGEPPTPLNPGPGCYFAPRCYQSTAECFKKYPATKDVGSGHLVACDILN